MRHSSPSVLYLCAAVVLLLSGCSRSTPLVEVPAEEELRLLRLTEIEQQISLSPGEGNLHVQRLTLLLADKEVAFSARQLWQSLLKVPGGPPVLVGLISHPNLVVRMNAAKLAGETRLEEAVPILKKRAEDRAPEVRRTSVWALRQMKEHDCFYLLALLLKDSAWEVRAEAALAMGSYPSRRTVRRLIPLLKDSDEYVRYCAAQVLLEIVNPETRQEFVALAAKSPPDSTERAVASFALARTGSVPDLAATEEFLKKSNCPYRIFAAESLAKAAPTRAVAVFREVLGTAHVDEELRKYMADVVAHRP